MQIEFLVPWAFHRNRRAPWFGGGHLYFPKLSSKRDGLGATSVTRKPTNQPNRKPNTLSDFPVQFWQPHRACFHIRRGIFELQWVTWKCTPAHHYFVQKAMLFRDAGLCGLLTPGAGGPAACGTSCLLGTPVAKPIYFQVSRFSGVTCSMVFPIKKD